MRDSNRSQIASDQYQIRFRKVLTLYSAISIGDWLPVRSSVSIILQIEIGLSDNDVKRNIQY